MRFFLTVLALIAMWTCSLSAQTTNEVINLQIKEQKEMQKYAKKLAKADKKEGWERFPSENFLEDQYFEKLRLESISDKVSQNDKEFESCKYVFGKATTRSKDIQVAYEQAKHLARTAIAEQFVVEVDMMVNDSVLQIQTDDYELFRQFLHSSTDYVKSKVTGVRPIITEYRKLGKELYEVSLVACTLFEPIKKDLYKEMKIKINKEKTHVELTSSSKEEEE